MDWPTLSAEQRAVTAFSLRPPQPAESATSELEYM